MHCLATYRRPGKDSARGRQWRAAARKGLEALGMHSERCRHLISWASKQHPQVTDVLPWPKEAHPCGRVDTVHRRNVGVAAQQDALGLARR